MNPCLQPHWRGGRLGQEEPSEGVPGPVLCGHQRLQTGCGAIPRHGLHLHLIWADGLQDFCHLHGLRVHDRPQTSRPSWKGRSNIMDVCYWPFLDNVRYLKWIIIIKKKNRYCNGCTNMSLQVIKGAEILEVLHSLPSVRQYLFSLYECRYSVFFQSLGMEQSLTGINLKKKTCCLCFL